MFENSWLSTVKSHFLPADDTDLFTGVLFNNYGPPNGFCFDILCDDEPIIDNKHSPDYNVDRRVSKLSICTCHLTHWNLTFSLAQFLQQ